MKNSKSAPILKEKMMTQPKPSSADETLCDVPSSRGLPFHSLPPAGTPRLRPSKTVHEWARDAKAADPPSQTDETKV